MWLHTGLLVLYLQATWAQINELTPITAMPQITTLDVRCERTGMTVNVQFDRPYNGIIFSKGYYSIPSCQYVEVDSRRSDYTFFIPKEDCGTVTFPDPTNQETILNFENTIIFQMDPSFQEAWDLARRISCQWVDIFKKRIEFQPFVVDMLDVVSVPFQGDEIECWMDLQIGTFPKTQPINGIVKIGQEMSIIIYIGGNTDDIDVRVRDCYAFDTPNYNDSVTKRLQLTDLEGCPVQPKLIDYWKRTLQTGNTGASIIAFTSLNAFKFPDGMDVYITCNIEVYRHILDPPSHDHQLLDLQLQDRHILDLQSLDHQLLDRHILDHQLLDLQLQDRHIHDHQSLDHQLLDRHILDPPSHDLQSLDHQLLDRHILDHQLLDLQLLDLPFTRPPITRPPVTRPPITRPPYTRPPITRPPVTRPPYTRPPITRPPITRPPITRPPVTRPPYTRPPITRPPITRPPITRPPFTRPPVTRPPIRPPTTKTSWSGNAPPDHPFHSFHYQPIRPRRFRRYATKNADKYQLSALNLPETQVIALRTRSFRVVKEGFLDSNVVRLQGPLYKVS
ncbi:uncharacterized protein LOC111088153 [Limulus polyphemus]|uniref:Uncharacterized protein LOC111088153 n=1 Tax=Limulus polyphemus TaxID=6850 RepID=A0ABM1TAX6_LIMPO|nr:uncharacterized protein LOC111088153 [Limulus polyphemus]